MRKITKKFKTKQDIVYEIAKKKNLTIKTASLLVDTVFQEIAQAILRGQRVQLRNFASFGLKKYKAYTGTDPRTQKRFKVKAKKRLWFKVGLFNKSLNKK